jgi:hypothetical protein
MGHYTMKIKLSWLFNILDEFLTQFGKMGWSSG